MSWEKHKWYILGYLLYMSIVLAFIWNEKRNFGPKFIIWCISIPIALYIVNAYVSYYRKNIKAKTPSGMVNCTTKTTKSFDDNIEDDGSNSDIVQSWSLIDFAKIHGKMQVGDFTNRVTGKTFKSCIFIDNDGNTIYVSFHSELGVLTPLQIKEKRNVLKVGLLSSNNYVLYEEWDDVDLDIE